MTEIDLSTYTLWSLLDPTYLDMLPEDRADGSILGEEGQFSIYIRNYLLSVAFLLFTLFLHHVFFKLTKHAVYAGKNLSDKLIYLSLWNANLHHIIVCILSIFYLKNPQC
jgi:hypothetical protein